MDFLTVTFPISQVTTSVVVPPLVAFAVSFFTSMAGVSGAFVLLPFQMSVLGYTSPSVSATNQLFNIVAIPSGVWRYLREGRMVWPLTLAVIIGTLPGVIIGGWVRLEFLPNPEKFKFFAGLVLLYIGLRLLRDVLQKKQSSRAPNSAGPQKVSNTRFSLSEVSFDFGEETYRFPVPWVLLLCFVVGIIGGVYGIGGGAIVAPFFVTFFGLPVHAVAGAALMGTFVTSVAGAFVYQGLALYYPTMTVAPDWYLGLLFGLGGFCGMYFGARCQKHLPARAIKVILCVCVLFVAGGYVLQFVTKAL